MFLIGIHHIYEKNKKNNKFILYCGNNVNCVRLTTHTLVQQINVQRYFISMFFFNKKNFNKRVVL